MFNASQYRDQLAALLPKGKAWLMEGATALMDVLLAMAQEPARLDARTESHLSEIIPMTTAECLSTWERVTGLPETCAGLANSTEARRNGVVAKLRAIGGATPQYFIDLAAVYGYTVTITEFDTTTIGDTIGDPIPGDAWLHAWQVNATLTNLSIARVGLSVIGDPLASWGAEQLECLINNSKPAHTTPIFSYT